MLCTGDPAISPSSVAARPLQVHRVELLAAVGRERGVRGPSVSMSIPEQM